MKKIKLNHCYLFILLISLSLSSCSEEPCFSCDDTVNEWVLENKSLIESFDRSDLIQLGPSKQRAALRAMSSEKRKEVWLDKVSYVRENKLSDDEKKHFEIIEDFIAGLDFDKELTKEQEEFVNDWFQEGKKLFNWDDKFLVESFYFITNSFRGLDEDIIIGGDENCNCRSSTECRAPGDPGPLSFCTFGGCDRTFTGCGFLGLFSCYGTCS